ncbi:MAG: capsule assembly Wzi family protein, partial [Bacteroidota bacterium]
MPSKLKSYFFPVDKKTDYSKQFDYGFDLELYNRFDRDKTNHFWLHEGYGELKYRFLRLQAGVREEVFGIHDTTLSSGSFIWSQNARPMPKITLSTPGFIDVPFTQSIVQFKSLLSHGWFEHDRYVHNPLLHHKNVYLNIGPKWPVTLTVGMEHFVMWGGESTDPEILQIPTGWDIYKRVFVGSEIPVD